MRRFRLKVYRAPGDICTLTLQAADAVGATAQARAQGYHVFSAHAVGAGLLPQRRGTRFSVPLFSQELLALLQAGLSLVETIGILARKSRDASARRVLEELARHLREGLPLSRALQEMPESFPPLYVAIIRTSEQTGDLIAALDRYLSYHRQFNVVRDKIVAASVYPALLIVVGLLVVLFLLGYVVPRFSQVYDNLNGNLPWMSRVLMTWGNFLASHAALVTTGFLSFCTASLIGLTRPSTKAWLLKWVWRLPDVGEKIRLYQLARFTRTLAMLINAGIPFVTSLSMVQEILQQPVLRKGLVEAAASITEGQAISSAFAKHDLATEVGVSLLAVGERSGNMGQTLERIARLYDEEIGRWMDWFSRLFEPLLMVAIGMIIGTVVMLMYLPIFELASSIQ